MKHDGIDNSRNSDGQYPTDQNMPTPKASESDFLTKQAADAKAAMIRTLQGMKATVGKVTDLRPYVRPHPWLVGASALVVGFATGAVLGLVRRRTAKMQKANPHSNGRLHLGPEKEPVASKSFLFGIAGPFLAALLQTVLRNSMTESASPAIQGRGVGLSRNDSAGSCI